MPGISVLLAAALAVAPAEPPTPGTISIEPVAGQLGPEENQIFSQAIATALSDASFTPIPAPGKGRYVARFTVTRHTRGVISTKAPKSSGYGGVGGGGVAFGVPLGSAPPRVSGLAITELGIEIIGRASQQQVWSGRALTAQAEGTKADLPASVAAKLASAVIRHFPAQAEETVAVP